MASNYSQLNKTVTAVLKTLSPRNRDILSRRFGIRNGKKETLESIGASYKITRERVRQIEETTLRQLMKNAPSMPDVQNTIENAKAVISDHQGVIRESNLFNLTTGSTRESAQNAGLVFLLALSPELDRLSENDRYHAFWALTDNYFKGFKLMTENIIDSLDKSNNVMSKEDLLFLARKSGIIGFDGQPLNREHVDLALNISKNIGKNIFNEVGLASWPEIQPKGVRDKAYLVLRKETQPRHFSEIANLINSSGFDGRKANVQTVHNELIKDSRFVLVGRGMYALSKWGYKSGTVKDVLIDILKNAQKPLPKAQLVAKVKDMRMVKENTILLNLQDSDIFHKLEDGTYKLKEL